MSFQPRTLPPYVNVPALWLKNSVEWSIKDKTDNKKHFKSNPLDVLKQE